MEKEKALALQRELERAAREKERRELEEKRKALEERRKLVKLKRTSVRVCVRLPGSRRSLNASSRVCLLSQEEQLRLAAEHKAAKEREAAKQKEAAVKKVNQSHRILILVFS